MRLPSVGGGRPRAPPFQRLIAARKQFSPPPRHAKITATNESGLEGVRVAGLRMADLRRDVIPCAIKNSY